jgi:hypothetical protein
MMSADEMASGGMIYRPEFYDDGFRYSSNWKVTGSTIKEAAVSV